MRVALRPVLLFAAALAVVPASPQHACASLDAGGPPSAGAWIWTRADARLLQSARAGDPMLRAAVHVATASAALWQQAAQLVAARDADHDLAWARFLDAHAGDLLFGVGSGPYRGISELEASLPVGSPEKARIGGMLQRSNERWLALQAYTRWLSSHNGAPGASDVLGEADRAYNRLTNWGGGTDFFFGRTVPQSATSKELRRIGALIRARH